jgi:4-hydroxybenzoate polyprenyltransferase
MILIIAMQKPQGHTDIKQKGWVEIIPSSIRPYIYLTRLDRPIGAWLLLLPGWWAILLAGGLDEWKTLTLFAIGALIMRSAGCIINDLWDRDLDKQVERTKSRPLANGDLSIRQACTCLIILLLLGFLILLQFNPLTILLGIISILLIVAYPLMKRITWWPQAFLGLTFNFGALMGWTAVTGELSWQAWALYASGFFWTLGYDTIYAMQDRNDDMMIGIKSSARFLTEYYKGPIVIPLYGFYILHFTLLIGAIFSMIEPSWTALLIIVPLGHLIWQVRTLDISNPKNSLQRFKSNQYYGLMVCMMIIMWFKINL